MTYDGTHQYYYDAENHIIQIDGTVGTCSTATACYVYDANGRRVEKTAGGTSTLYLHDLDGNVQLEMIGGGYTLSNEYVYFNNRLAAVYAGGTSGETLFVHPDHLGSTRLVTDYTGCIVDNLDYFPFGELTNLTPLCTMNDISHKFTSKERDDETGLDNFIARYYSSGSGRFMSPDWSDEPSPIPYANIADPQTLNLYAYVRNNPINAADPDGHCYPLCTILPGAAIGAVAGALAEMGSEVLRGEPINGTSIKNAAIAGAVSGGIIGLGPEAIGPALNVGLAIAGNVAGGGTERALNGEHVLDGKAVLGDAASGLLTGRIDVSSGRQIASPLVRKVTTNVIDAIIDAGRRATGNPGSTNNSSTSNPNSSPVTPTFNPNAPVPSLNQAFQIPFQLFGPDEFDLQQLLFQPPLIGCVTATDGFTGSTVTGCN